MSKRSYHGATSRSVYTLTVLNDNWKQLFWFSQYRTFAAPNAIQYAVEPQNYGVKIFEKYEDFFDPPYVIDKLGKYTH